MQRAKGTDRILDLLECLSRENRPMTRIQLGLATGMPRSTVYSLTDLLLQREWLEESESGLLQLGRQAGFSSNAYLHQNGFEQLARRILEELAEKTETLAEIDVVENWVHVVAISEGRMAQGYLRPIEGARLPLMPTAAARVVLAHVAPETIRRHISDDDLIDVAGKPVTWERFFEEMRLGQLQGYVWVRGWLEGTVSTLACPLVDGEGRILASLCIIVSTRALDERLHFYLVHLQEAAQALSGIIKRESWPYAELQWRKMHHPDRMRNDGRAVKDGGRGERPDA